jgi:cell division protein FtsW (lipid II flippase)
VPPQKLMRFAVPLYIVGVILLVLVFLFGIKVNGAGAGCRSASRASSPRKS